MIRVRKLKELGYRPECNFVNNEYIGIKYVKDCSIGQKEICLFCNFSTINLKFNFHGYPNDEQLVLIEEEYLSLLKDQETIDHCLKGKD